MEKTGTIRQEENDDDVIIFKITKRSIDDEIMIKFGNGQYSVSMPDEMATYISDQLAILQSGEKNPDFKEAIQTVIDYLSFN
jgi:hypothetical protein